MLAAHIQGWIDLLYTAVLFKYPLSEHVSANFSSLFSSHILYLLLHSRCSATVLAPTTAIMFAH